MVQPLKNETVRHQSAFDYYYALGDDRSYAKVADQFNVSIGTINRWAGSFAWQRRVVERDHKISLQMQRETDKQILNDRKAYRNIIKASIETYINNLKKGKISIDKVSDLRALMDIDMRLMEVLDRGTANSIGDLINMSGESMDTINRLNDELAGVVEPPDLEDDEDA